MGGGAPAAPAGQKNPTWGEVKEDQGAVTYMEFLVEEGLPNDVDIPDLYFTDPAKPGTVKKRTPTQWHQIRGAWAPPARYYPGNKIHDMAVEEIAVKRNETRAMQDLYRDAVRTAFWCEVGHPQWTVPAPLGDPDHMNVTIPVVLKADRHWSRKMVAPLRKFDHWDPRPGRKATFSFLTFDGGFYKPYHFQLAPEAIAAWASLWGTNQVQLSVYRHDGSMLFRGTQSAGHGRSQFVHMTFPPELHRQPRYEIPLPTEDDTFEGGPWDYEYKEGWRFDFAFNGVRLTDVEQMDYAFAQVIGESGFRKSKEWKGPMFSRAGTEPIRHSDRKTYSTHAPCW
jgi:hypothetical protein